MKAGVLYISYDGMLEPLGQSQVLAYLERLARGRRIHLISFEKERDWSDSDRRDAVGRRIVRAGIRWHPLRYHKRPSSLATAFDVGVGTVVAVYLAVRHRLRLMHARSYVAGLMALPVKRATASAFLFDMRGFWADERVDGDLWPAGGRLYRAAKGAERRLLLAADHVVTLTDASAAELGRFPYLAARMPPISVIPTCADLDHFTIQGTPQREPFVLGYVGSLGTWYLLDEMLRCFLFLREQVTDASLLIVNRGEHDLVRRRAAELGIDQSAMVVASAEPGDMPPLIARMSAGLALIKPAYSKIASAPTKLAEYLGCGVPCLGNAGVGDVEQILESRRVGVSVAGLTDAQLRAGMARLVKLAREKDIQRRCRQAAQELFSLGAGVEAYDRIYRELGA